MRSTCLSQPCKDLQPASDGLQPTSDGLQPTSDGIQPTSDACRRSIRRGWRSLRWISSPWSPQPEGNPAEHTTSAEESCTKAWIGDLVEVPLLTLFCRCPWSVPLFRAIPWNLHMSDGRFFTFSASPANRARWLSRSSEIMGP